MKHYWLLIGFTAFNDIVCTYKGKEPETLEEASTKAISQWREHTPNETIYLEDFYCSDQPIRSIDHDLIRSDP
jgi:hypothetical protein